MKFKFGIKHLFYIIYVVGISGAAVIGFFGTTKFAYDVFNSGWADILFSVLLSALYLTAFVHSVYVCRESTGGEVEA